HRVDGVLQLGDLAAHVDRHLLGQIAVRDGGRHLGDVAHLFGERGGHEVHRLGELAPRAADAFDLGLAAEASFGAHLAGDARDLVGERPELVDHRVDRVLELGDLALDVDGDLLGEVAVRDRSRDLRDVAHLRREVRGQRVHVVREVLPDAADAFDVRLAAELALGADLLRDARHLCGEGPQLVDHRVDRVLELEDLTADVDRDLLRQVAVRNGGRDVGDVTDLIGEVAGERVHVVGEVLPDAADAFDVRLAAELALGADFLRDARHLCGEGAQLVDHRVDGLLHLEDLTLDFDGDLAREVAVGNGGRDVGDVAHLRGEVRCEAVHRLGQVLPRAADAGDLRLAAELAFLADLACDAGDLVGERRELVDHRVDGDLLREVALRDGGRDVGDVAHLRGEVRRERVHRVGEVLPDARDAAHLRLAAELAVGADLAGDARDLVGERRELLDHRVHGAADAEELALDRAALDLEVHLLGQVALRDGVDD